MGVPVVSLSSTRLLEKLGAAPVSFVNGEGISKEKEKKLGRSGHGMKDVAVIPKRLQMWAEIGWYWRRCSESNMSEQVPCSFQQLAEDNRIRLEGPAAQKLGSSNAHHRNSSQPKKKRPPLTGKQFQTRLQWNDHQRSMHKHPEIHVSIKEAACPRRSMCRWNTVCCCGV